MNWVMSDVKNTQKLDIKININGTAYHCYPISHHAVLLGPNPLCDLHVCDSLPIL